MTTITQALRRALKQSSMSQYEVARRAGVAASQLSRFKTGKCSLDLRTADALCQVLDLTLTGANGHGNAPRQSRPELGVEHRAALEILTGPLAERRADASAWVERVAAECPDLEDAQTILRRALDFKAEG